MKHNHSCKCEHNSVKFCKHCNTIYCEGCNQEWTPKSIWAYQNYTSNYQPYTIRTGQLTHTAQNPGQIDLTQCSHKE